LPPQRAAPGLGRRILAFEQRLAFAIYGIDDELNPVPPEFQGDLRQSEIRAQIEAIRRERPIRFIATALMMAIYLIFLPLPLVIGLAAGVIAMDLVELRLLREATEAGGNGRIGWRWWRSMSARSAFRCPRR
jgi:hypothetical protein